MASRFRTILAAGLSGILPLVASAQTTPHASMLKHPDVSRTHIVFSYANDLWIVPRTGGVALPLADPPGVENWPHFSPDGKTIAFVGNYDGGTDIYTIPTAGGQAQRLTHHPAGEHLTDWTMDDRLVFSAHGLAGLGRQEQLFTISTDGGLPEQLPVPYGANGTISPDGTWLAYSPYQRDSRTWKRYRGGMATDIWLFNLEDHSARRVTDWEGTDTLPMWHGRTLYYLSDAGPAHRLNIWSYDIETGNRTQVTAFTEFDVKWPSIGPGTQNTGEIVFQYGASLYLLDLATGISDAVDVRIPGDRPKLRPTRVDAARNITSLNISPTGKRAVIAARGDIWTAPAEHGSPRNLTRTDGTAERDPAWSPDGRWIAYFSDATGEYELYITQSDGKGETRQLTFDNGPFKSDIDWAPDSKALTFSDKTGALYLFTFAQTEDENADADDEDGGDEAAADEGDGEMEEGDVEEEDEGDEDDVMAVDTLVLVDTDPWAETLAVSWSQDGRWLAYSKGEQDQPGHSIWLYNVETGEKQQVTSDMFNEWNPVFDRRGDYLYFVSSRSFNPTYSDIDNTYIYRGSQVLLAVPLRADMDSPWLPKSDEESWDGKSKDEDKADGAEDGGKDEAADDGGEDAGEDEGDAPDDEAAVIEDDGVSGTWEGSASGVEGLPDGGLPFTLTLTMAKDNTVTGSLAAGPFSGACEGTYNPETGKLSMTLTLPDATVTLELKIEDGTMTGTASAEGDTYQIMGTRTASGSDAEAEEKEEKEAEKVKIDLDGFERRALPLPVSAGQFGRLAVNNKDQLIYVRRAMNGQAGGVMLFDIDDEKKEEKTVAKGVGGFSMSADGKKLLLANGGGGTIQDASAGGKGKKVTTRGMVAVINPRNEWKQVFTDAWRIQRDFFYDPNMHGVDWQGVYDQYVKLIDDCNSREDVNTVIGEMIAELNVGHAYLWGGGTERAPSISVGMLGCNYELAEAEQGTAYRISKIYEGAPWDSDARGPLSQPGVDVKEGDYLLAVNGIPIDTVQDPWAAFAGLAGRTTTITVSDKPVIDDDAREVLLKPTSSEGGLRYRAWIEHNRAYVEEKSNGQVGYIYVPDTGVNGQNNLYRQFFGQRSKKALIIDERWNGGGQIPTRFIELLNRPVVSYWARRDGNDWTWPPDSHQGPKCMLINGLAGSGGDMFPWLFRYNKLGKLIGTRTWGGLVGISGNPALIDGGYTSVPTFAFYETDGTWGIEGHGVDPDIEVIDDPSLMVNGGDPQLDAAIQLMLDEIQTHPYVKPPRPAYPDRSGMGVREEDK